MLGPPGCFAPVESNLTEAGDLIVASRMNMNLGSGLERGPQAVLGQVVPPVHAILPQATQK